MDSCQVFPASKPRLIDQAEEIPIMPQTATIEDRASRGGLRHEWLGVSRELVPCRWRNQIQLEPIRLGRRKCHDIISESESIEVNEQTFYDGQ